MDELKKVWDEIEALKRRNYEKDQEAELHGRMAKYRLNRIGMENLRTDFGDNVEVINNEFVFAPEFYEEIYQWLLDEEIEEYYEYVVADYTTNGVNYSYVHNYTDEPAINVQLQGANTTGQLSAHSFQMKADHLLSTGSTETIYTGVFVYPEGTSIPTSTQFTGRMAIHAVCSQIYTTST